MSTRSAIHLPDVLAIPMTDMLDAERALLGSLLQDENAIDAVAPILPAGPASFWQESHRTLYSVLVDLRAAGTPIDIVPIKAELSRRKHWDKVGGFDFLMSLASSVPSGLRAAYYATAVRDAYLDRELAQVTWRTCSRLKNRQGTVAERIAQTQTELAELARQAGPVDRGGLRTTSAADVEPRAVEWLWPGRIPLGKITTIVGDPKIGKSILTLDLAARVSRGMRWPDTQNGEKAEPGRVLLLSAEDDIEDTIVPRLQAAAADLGNVEIVGGVSEPKAAGSRLFQIDRDLYHLERKLAATEGVRLVVLDPVSAFMGDIESHINAAVRGALAPLAELAARFRVAVVCVTHLTKGSGTTKALYRAMGSLAFTAVARAVWLVTFDPEDRQRRLLLNAGCNLAEDNGGLAYTVRGGIANRDVPIVAWEDKPVGMSADEALANEQRANQDRGAVAHAVEWLKAELANGPVPSAELCQKASEEGISEPTLKRARSKLGVIALPQRNGKQLTGWLAALPVQGVHSKNTDTVERVDPLDPVDAEDQGDQGDQEGVRANA